MRESFLKGLIIIPVSQNYSSKSDTAMFHNVGHVQLRER